MKSRAVLSAEAAAKKLADKYVSRDGVAKGETAKAKIAVMAIDDNVMLVARFILNSPPKVKRAGISRMDAWAALTQALGLKDTVLFNAIREEKS